MRGAGFLCNRREVGQWVLVLVGGVDGEMARQDGEGSGQEEEGLARRRKWLDRKMMVTVQEDELTGQEDEVRPLWPPGTPRATGVAAEVGSTGCGPR